MPACAFLTMYCLDGFVDDDMLAAEPLHALGWSVERVPWRRAEAAWDRYDLVVVRSTWDYQAAPGEYLDVLAGVEARTRLENPHALIRWNLNKKYLIELAARGLPVVPTRFSADVPTRAILEALCSDLEAEEIVLKPTVSASAEDTFRIRREHIPRWIDDLTRRFDGRDYMVQPYQSRIEVEGETSLFFFDGEYSHAVRKTPLAGDFRVQEEHGGKIEAIEAGEDVLRLARRVIDSLDVSQAPLYARIDLVRDDPGEHRLMEVELIEPALYLRMDPGAPGRFARAIARRQG